MAIGKLVKTAVDPNNPLDGSAQQGGQPAVSDFLTIQSLTNFAAMTGAITAAWHALATLDASIFGQVWIPYAFAGLFGAVSIAISPDAMRRNGKWDLGATASAAFIALINSLVLAGAVVGTRVAVDLPEPQQLQEQVAPSGAP
jgi:hypothetical protein